MEMTDAEIRESWSNAIDRRMHIRVLAELNDVPDFEMRKKLERLKVEGLPTRKNIHGKKIDEETVILMRRMGAGDSEIGRVLGCAACTVTNWRYQNGVN